MPRSTYVYVVIRNIGPLVEPAATFTVKYELIDWLAGSPTPATTSPYGVDSLDLDRIHVWRLRDGHTARHAPECLGTGREYLDRETVKP